MTFVHGHGMNVSCV